MTKGDKQRLAESASLCALYVRTWSPGDGITRYRFFTDPSATYFNGPSEAVATVLGFKAAEQWVYAYRAGYFAGIASTKRAPVQTVIAHIGKFYRCGGCDHFHPLGWTGDCRDDAKRFREEQIEELYGREGIGWTEVEESQQPSP